MKRPRTYVHPDIQTDRQTHRQTEILCCSFCLLTYIKHEHLSKGENFFFTHAITILSLFTYSVCDEKVEMNIRIYNSTPFTKSSTTREQHAFTNKLCWYGTNHRYIQENIIKSYTYQYIPLHLMLEITQFSIFTKYGFYDVPYGLGVKYPIRTPIINFFRNGAIFKIHLGYANPVRTLRVNLYNISNNNCPGT